VTLDINTVRVIVTVLSFAAFVGIVAYAASARNKPRFDAAARLPFEEGDAP
jgi:cytochrome c oxidase cbb3-type subunit IV